MSTVYMQSIKDKKIEKELDKLVCKLAPSKQAEVRFFVEQAVKYSNSQLLERLSEKVGEKRVICKTCKKPIDETARTYDGVVGCECEDGKYLYEHSWDDIGFNEALNEVKALIQEEKSLL